MKRIQYLAHCFILVNCLIGYTITSIQAQELREAGLEKGIKFGSPISELNDQQYQQLFVDQVNVGTITAYWKYTTHNQEGTYTWGSMDAAMTVGEQNGLELHGHPLVWGSDYHIPDWVKNKPLADGEAIMLDHIRTVAGRYGNRIKTWDVVNEAIEDDGTYRNCYWNRAMTGEFIAKAFIEAKAVVPNAVLLYNDYGIEANPAKFNTVKNMLVWIQSLGAQVDGLGWQLHTDVTTVLDPNFQLEQYMMDISNLGLKNYVTELDITMPDSTAYWIQQQRLAYRKIAEIFMCNPTTGDYFQTWAISDKYTWLNNYQPQNAPFYPLPFDENYNKKPAYWGIVEAFESAACDEVCKVSSPPVIDGSGSEWSSTNYDITRVILGNPNPTDLSAEIQLTWDDNYLYVYGTVTDDIMMNDSGASAYEDDGFEIYLDGGNERAFTYDANDHQLLFRVNDPDVIYWSAQGQTNPAGVDFARTITPDGYTIEVRIAWSFIGVSPFPGMDLGIDIHVNDDDDGGVREHKMTWFAREDQAWNNPSLFNTIQLSDNQCVSTTHAVECKPSVLLEGPYEPAITRMDNSLFLLNLLPPGQPYNTPPWNYSGTEGNGWNSSDYPPESVDWVLVSLRTSLSVSDEVARFASVLHRDGHTTPLASIELNSLIDSVYIVIEHRNHLPVMSPGLVPIINNTLFYDFRSQDSYIANGAGFGQKEINGSWAMFAGNVDQSNPQGYEITGADRILWQAQNGNFGIYESTDFNFDGDVNGNDRVIWSGNNGISSSIPR